MSAICILTPIVIGSWPMIAAAISGVASAMGFSMVAGQNEEPVERSSGRVETDIPNSEVLKESMGVGEKIRIQKGDLTIEFGRDERGACSVCVTGKNHSNAELRKIGQEVAGRVVQQFTYNKLITELKKRNYSVVNENVQADASISVRVRLNR